MRASKIQQTVLQKLRTRNHILDVGCGDGSLVNFLAKKTSKKIVGLDIRSSGFKKAFRKARKLGSLGLVRCVKGDAHRAAQYFPDEKFDAVTMIYTLHHLKQPLSALREIQKILQPNGEVLVVDMVFCQDEDKEECRRYSVGDILQMMMETRYRPIRIEELEQGLVLVTAGNNFGKEASA